MSMTSQKDGGSQAKPAAANAWTPGPWKVFYTSDGRAILGVGDRDGGGITDTGDVATNDLGLWRSGVEKEANARLIAAAPDLYAALAAAMAFIAQTAEYRGGHTGAASIVDRGDVALRKARGEASA